MKNLNVIENAMVDALTESLKNYITITDYGEQTIEGDKYYVSRITLSISGTSKIKATDLGGNAFDTQIRSMADSSRVRDIAKMLLGIDELSM